VPSGIGKGGRHCKMASSDVVPTGGWRGNVQFCSALPRKSRALWTIFVLPSASIPFPDEPFADLLGGFEGRPRSVESCGFVASRRR